ncbi:hypothetical protein DFH09DRAFT_211125 [Mycena vulgaris]|nr:hypothetical protein DFH09DRAFT_211125 [Mycena vulgaris]
MVKHLLDLIRLLWIHPCELSIPNLGPYQPNRASIAWAANICPYWDQRGQDLTCQYHCRRLRERSFLDIDSPHGHALRQRLLRRLGSFPLHHPWEVWDGSCCRSIDWKSAGISFKIAAVKMTSIAKDLEVLCAVGDSPNGPAITCIFIGSVNIEVPGRALRSTWLPMPKKSPQRRGPETEQLG